MKEIKTEPPSASGFEHATSLSLMDGSKWSIVAVDPQASRVVSRLKDAMQLRHQDDLARQVLVKIETPKFNSNAQLEVSPQHLSILPTQPESIDTLSCYLSSNCEGDLLLGQLLELSHFFSRQSEAHFGLLLHGALAERGGYGVILAGPPDVGKTTASTRLKPPWRSLSDDTTLVVRDNSGEYWAHPWPTWSKFVSDGPGCTWDVQRAVPLKGIFFLVQDQEDRVELVHLSQAACLLVETAESSSWLFSEDMEQDEVRARNVQRFDNICILAKSVPCYLLHLSLVGTFWREIERVIDNS